MIKPNTETVQQAVQDLFNEMSSDSRWELNNLRVPLIEMKLKPVLQSNGVRWKGWGWEPDGRLKIIGDYADTQMRVYLWIKSGMIIDEWVWDHRWREELYAKPTVRPW